MSKTQTLMARAIKWRSKGKTYDWIAKKLGINGDRRHAFMLVKRGKAQGFTEATR